MAFTEQQEYKLEILPNKVIQVRRSDIVLKDGEVVGTTYPRHCVCPGDDVSEEPADVQACATALWTPEVVTAYADSLDTDEGA